MSVFSVQATAEANNLTAVAGAKDLYSKNMEKVWRGRGGVTGSSVSLC